MRSFTFETGQRKTVWKVLWNQSNWIVIIHAVFTAFLKTFISGTKPVYIFSVVKGPLLLLIALTNMQIQGFLCKYEYEDLWKCTFPSASFAVPAACACCSHSNSIFSIFPGNNHFCFLLFLWWSPTCNPNFQVWHSKKIYSWALPFRSPTRHEKNCSTVAGFQNNQAGIKLQAAINTS